MVRLIGCSHRLSPCPGWFSFREPVNHVYRGNPDNWSARSGLWTPLYDCI